MKVDKLVHIGKVILRGVITLATLQLVYKLFCKIVRVHVGNVQL